MFLVFTVRVFVADRARLEVFEVVDTPFARADIEVAVTNGVACLLCGGGVHVTAVVAMSSVMLVAINCGGSWRQRVVSAAREEAP